MDQMSFSDADYAGKRKKTRREVFLEEMEKVVPWKTLLGLIEPHHPVDWPRPSAVPAGADAAGSLDAEPVRTERLGDGESAVQDCLDASVCALESE